MQETVFIEQKCATILLAVDTGHTKASKNRYTNKIGIRMLIQNLLANLETFKIPLTFDSEDLVEIGKQCSLEIKKTGNIAN